jgi:hypothetical protein
MQSAATTSQDCLQHAFARSLPNFAQTTASRGLASLRGPAMRDLVMANVTFRGEMKGQTLVVLDAAAPLPDGTVVEVTPVACEVGSAAAVLAAMKAESRVTAEDVAELEKAIAAGRRPGAKIDLYRMMRIWHRKSGSKVDGTHLSSRQTSTVESSLAVANTAPSGEALIEKMRPR